MAQYTCGVDIGLGQSAHFIVKQCGEGFAACTVTVTGVSHSVCDAGTASHWVANYF